MEAVEKLKRGESIGPVTKTAMEGKDEAEEDSESATTDETKVDESGKEGETTAKDGEDGDVKESRCFKDEAKEGEEAAVNEEEESPVKEEEDIKEGMDMTEKPVEETTENIIIESLKPPSELIPPKSEGDDTSDTRSTASDFPPTPAMTETSETSPSDTPVMIVDNTIRDAEAIREIPSDTLINFDTSNIASQSTNEKVQNDDIPMAKEMSTQTEEKFGFEFPPRMNPLREMLGWEMLQMVLDWVNKEFSPDEQALARQLANNEISYRFLWLYYVPGSLVSMEDPVSKQQMAARVFPLGSS